MERRKDMMIAALWANSGFEGQEGANARREAIEELEENYQEAMKSVLIIGQNQKEEEIDKENPFFKQMEKGVQKIQKPRNDEGTVAQAISTSAVDEARREGYYAESDQE
jgi:hypothetical protein